MRRGEVWLIETAGGNRRLGVIVENTDFLEALRGIQVVPIKDVTDVPQTILSVRVDEPVPGIAAVYDVGPFAKRRFVEPIGEVGGDVMDAIEIALKLLYDID